MILNPTDMKNHLQTVFGTDNSPPTWSSSDNFGKLSSTPSCYLGLVSVDQRGGCGHHGAAAWTWERRDQGLRVAFRPLLQDLPQALKVVHQGPVHALLRPVRLQQAAQHRHVKVSGIARSLGQRHGQAGGGWYPGTEVGLKILLLGPNCKLIIQFSSWDTNKKCLNTLFEYTELGYCRTNDGYNTFRLIVGMKVFLPWIDEVNKWFRYLEKWSLNKMLSF